MGYSEKLKRTLLTNVDIITIPTLTKLLPMSKVASRCFGRVSSFKTCRAFSECVLRSFSSCDGDIEKKATSDADINAEPKSSSKITRTPTNALILNVLNIEMWINSSGKEAKLCISGSNVNGFNSQQLLGHKNNKNLITITLQKTRLTRMEGHQLAQP